MPTSTQARDGSTVERPTTEPPSVMVTGAAVLAGTGVDLDSAAQAGTATGILPDLVANAGALATTYTLWLLAMVSFTVAAQGLRHIGPRHPASTAAGALMGLGATLGAVAFLAVLALLAVVAPAGDPVLAAMLVWFGSTADWVATILIIGIPPLLMAVAGRDRWAPRWFTSFETLAVVAAAGTSLALLTGSGLTTYGFALVPVGVACSITMGVLLWRRA